MRKMFISMVLCCLFATTLASAQTPAVGSAPPVLTIRFANPRIIRVSGTDRFEFEVQVKTDAANIFYQSGRISLNFNNSALSTTDTDWNVALGPSYNFPNSLETPAYTHLVEVTGGVGSLYLNIDMISDDNVFANDPTGLDYTEVSTSYQTLMTVQAKITNGSAVAGISFIESGINGLQNFVYAAWSTMAFNDPCAYEGLNFSSSYLGRFFANSKWTQTGGSTDLEEYVNWTTAVNTTVWDGNASIPGGPECKIAVLRVEEYATITVPPAGKLTLSGISEINTQNGLIIQSDATGTGSLLATEFGGMGSADVQRYVTGTDKWHLIASPIQDLAPTDFVSANAIATNGDKYGLGYYNNTIPGFVCYTTSTIDFSEDFGDGKGYEVLRSSDGILTFTGYPEYLDLTATISLGTDKWNLLGNPYPSSIYGNHAADATHNFIDINMSKFRVCYEAIYFWNPTTATYEIINNASDPTNIAPGQGFFIRTDYNSSMNFTTAMRNHGTAVFKSDVIRPSIKLRANIAGKTMSTRIVYTQNATQGIDAGYDAGVFDGLNSDNSVLLATQIEGSNVNFGIQALPAYSYENSAVPVVLHAPAGSPVLFTTESSGFPGNIGIYLEDRVTGKFHRLDQDGSYCSIVLLSEAKGAGRFYLHATNTMGIDKPTEDACQVIPLPSEHKIRITGTFIHGSQAIVYSMNGSVLTSATLNNKGENEIRFNPSCTGVYLIKIDTGTASVMKKINWIN